MPMTHPNPSASLLRTPLFSAHQAAHARMVDFGGWEMPVNYGSQIDEHHAVRKHAGMFDVSHMCAIDLSGDCETFLRLVLANSIDKLKNPGQALYSCMLNPQGGVIDDLIVYCLGLNKFRLVVNAGTAAKDLVWLEQLSQSHKSDVQIVPRRDLAMIAVQGPQARALVWQALPESHVVSADIKPFHAVACKVAIAHAEFDMFIARTGYTGEDGFELMLPADRAIDVWQALIKVGVTPAGLGARDTLRLEAGMNLYGQDMDEEVSPLDAGLTWTVALNDTRDFVGKAALQEHGQKMQFLGLVLEEKQGILRSHQTVQTPYGSGIITSGTFSPTLQRAIALARLPLQTKIGDQVMVEIRNKLVPARVVKAPFVRQGKILVV